MFSTAFKVSFQAVIQIILLGFIGYILVRRKMFNEEGLSILSKFIIEVSLPLLIFTQLIKDFSFTLYPNWWLFSLWGVLVSLFGLILGLIFVGLIKELDRKLQFLSLITFQNSGYLPLVLVNTILPKEKQGILFIYIFLFLLGFNLLIWSLGTFMLNFTGRKRFVLGSLFSPPVIATSVSLLCIFFGLHKFFPEFLFKPLKMIGDCTLPLAIIVIGGNLAQIKSDLVEFRYIIFIIILKLMIMPLVCLYLILRFHFDYFLGLLILLQLSMPSAVSLSLILNYYKKKDYLISQGIFFTHLVGILSIALFLSLYFTLKGLP
ncbi:MAG: AEC family transporter [Candidatus Omnitrophica bacterium]|nr:AEC family transporter [Candidatus Omnitrophota bacterium]